MGITKIKNIIMKEDYISEYWLGPSAELIVWIRPNSAEKFGYTGGDPIKNRKNASTAYLTLNSDNLDRIEMVIKSFFDKFKNKKIRKIICCKIEGETKSTLFDNYGTFDEPNEEENHNISSINLFLKNNIKSSINIKTDFDYRFIGKMIISIGYSIFGECFLKSALYQEARKCIYPNVLREFKIKGVQTLSNTPETKIIYENLGFKSAVVISIIKSNDYYIMIFSINQKLGFICEIAPSYYHNSLAIKNEGYSLIIFPHLKISIETNCEKLLSHHLKNIEISELKEINKKILKSDSFFKHLPSIPKQTIVLKD